MKPREIKGLRGRFSWPFVRAFFSGRLSAPWNDHADRWRTIITTGPESTLYGQSRCSKSQEISTSRQNALFDPSAREAEARRSLYRARMSVLVRAESDKAGLSERPSRKEEL